MRALKLRNRLFWQISALIILITVIGAAAVSSFFIATGESSGKGSAINVSGSLRMQSYVTAFTVAETAGRSAAGKQEEIEAAVNEFEARYKSPRLLIGIPQEAESEIRKSYEAIGDEFYGVIRPLALKAAEDPAENQAFLSKIPGFVTKIDRFVALLENALETRMRWLAVSIGAVLLLSVVLCVILILYLRKTLFLPLEELSAVTERVRKRDFSARSTYGKSNEIGILSSDMNLMIGELDRLYHSLERQVEDKTERLRLANEEIQLLYKLREKLSSDEVSPQTLKDALSKISSYVGSDETALLLHEGNLEKLFAGARISDGTVSDEAFLQAFAAEFPKLAEKQAVLSAENRIYVYPLQKSGRVYGSFYLRFRDDYRLQEKDQFLKAIASMFASAIEDSTRKAEDSRLALYEERSTIARELHDSIAQSLSYSKIQLMRLSLALSASPKNEEADAALSELRTGISEAYKQLREVLTAFRMKLRGAGFQEDVRSVLESFRSRSGVECELSNAFHGFELSPNDEVHAVQVLREALSNIEKHAHASHASVRIEPSREGHFVMEITDDGVGIGSVRGREGHFGLSIMKERAAALGGEVTVENVRPHGTRVKLVFNPGRSV